MDHLNSDRRHTFIPSLESARGIAALCVCGMHSLMFWSQFRDSPMGTQPMQFFVGMGNSAVNFFFILSGFVLFRSLDNMKADNLGKISVLFAISRLFRIYPAVLIVIFVFSLIEPWALFHGLDDRSWTNIIRDALLIQSTMDWPTWSTRVEIAATPLILTGWFLRKWLGTKALIPLGVALAAFSFLKEFYGGDEIGQELFVFIAGMLLADCGPIFRRLRPLFAVPLVLAALYVVSRARIWIGWHEQWTLVTETVCLFVITGAIAYDSVPNRWLEIRPLRFFGRISYSFYLVHFVVLMVIVRHLPAAPMKAISFRNATIECLEVFAIVAAISFGLSLVLYRLVEVPGIAVGRALIQKLESWKMPRNLRRSRKSYAR